VSEHNHGSTCKLLQTPSLKPDRSTCMWYHVCTVELQAMSARIASDGWIGNQE